MIVMILYRFICRKSQSVQFCRSCSNLCFIKLKTRTTIRFIWYQTNKTILFRLNTFLYVSFQIFYAIINRLFDSISYVKWNDTRINLIDKKVSKIIKNIKNGKTVNIYDKLFCERFNAIMYWLLFITFYALLLVYTGEWM